jgi:hypothetical protein
VEYSLRSNVKLSSLDKKFLINKGFPRSCSIFRANLVLGRFKRGFGILRASFAPRLDFGSAQEKEKSCRERDCSASLFLWGPIVVKRGPLRLFDPKTLEVAADDK